MPRLIQRHTTVDSPNRIGIQRGPTDQSITVVDSGQGLDALAASMPSVVLTGTAEFGIAVDAIVSEAVMIALSDSGVGVEAAAQTRFISATTESGFGFDTATLSVSIAVADLNGSFSDAVAALSVALSASDTDSGTTEQAASLSAALSASDSAQGQNSSSLDAGAVFTLADSAQGVDEASIVVSITLDDSGSGVEVPDENISWNLSDESVQALDTVVDLLVQISAVDFGSEVESLALVEINKLLTVFDSALGVDFMAPAIEVDFDVTDAGVGHDHMVSVKVKPHWPLLVVDKKATATEQNRYLIVEEES